MLRFILPSILWTIFIIIVSLVPSSSMDLSSLKFEHADKLIHVGMYTGFSLFWTTGLKRQNISKKIWNDAFLISILGGFLLSFILEILQEYFTTSRSFELLDLLANGIGCIFGIILFLIIYPNYKR